MTRIQAPAHRYQEDRETPGTCAVCHLADQADQPRNRAHDPEAVAEAEAARAWAHTQHQRRYGTD